MFIVNSDKEKAIASSWKNIKPLREMILSLPEVQADISNEDIFKITILNATKEEKGQIENTALALRSWRKGPFFVDDIFIDSEWQSHIKYNLLREYFDLKDKVVADIGCNNGYYLFRMQEDSPKKLVGFDPTPLFWCQFDFINHFAKSKIVYELLGVEHLPAYHEKFDIIFCLGVLYHRSDPIACLKNLKEGLLKDGELILDTFIIDGEEEIALCPKKTYSKISNIYFIPTFNTLKNWCIKAGFKEVTLLKIKVTDEIEQRKTDWILGESLEDFLDKKDKTKTIEGYPAPKRIYIKAKI